MIKTIRENLDGIKIILVAPPLVDDTNPQALPRFEGSTEKAEQLVELYQLLSEKMDLYFINLAENISPSESDGVHIREVDQEQVAEMFLEKIKNIL